MKGGEKRWVYIVSEDLASQSYGSHRMTDIFVSASDVEEEDEGRQMCWKEEKEKRNRQIDEDKDGEEDVEELSKKIIGLTIENNRSWPTCQHLPILCLSSSRRPIIFNSLSLSLSLSLSQSLGWESRRERERICLKLILLFLSVFTSLFGLDVSLQ